MLYVAFSFLLSINKQGYGASVSINSAQIVAEHMICGQASDEWFLQIVYLKFSLGGIIF